jgi:hypothetical protein
MKPVLKILLGLMLILTASGCCCLDGRGYGTCSMPGPNATMAGIMTPPQVTIR